MPFKRITTGHHAASIEKDLLHVLQSAGFEGKQALLYVAGLQLGSAPASEYARAAGINRITAYHLLEEMVEAGRATMERKARAKWYSPVAPEFLDIEARKNADALHRMLPELRSLRGAHYRRPHVRFFDGWEGLRHVYDDTLTAHGELLNFANSAVVRRFWPDYDEEYVAERVKRGIRLRGIAPDDSWGQRVHGEDRQRLREIRLVPAAEFDFQNEINIYDHKVAICSFGGARGNLVGFPSRAPLPFEESSRAGPRRPARSDDLPVGSSEVFGVIIESKEVAETQRQIFEMAWRYAGTRSRR